MSSSSRITVCCFLSRPKVFWCCSARSCQSTATHWETGAYEKYNSVNYRLTWRQCVFYSCVLKAWPFIIPPFRLLGSRLWKVFKQFFQMCSLDCFFTYLDHSLLTWESFVSTYNRQTVLSSFFRCFATGSQRWSYQISSIVKLYKLSFALSIVLGWYLLM